MRLCAWRCHALADAAYLCVCSAGPPRERQRRTTDPDSSRDSSRRAFGRTSGARPQRMRSHIVPPRPPVLRPILPRRALPISALGLRTPRLDLRPPISVSPGDRPASTRWAPEAAGTRAIQDLQRLRDSFPPGEQADLVSSARCASRRLASSSFAPSLPTGPSPLP